MEVVGGLMEVVGGLVGVVGGLDLALCIISECDCSQVVCNLRLH